MELDGSSLSERGTYGEGKTLVLSRRLLMTMVAKLVPGDR